MEVTKYYMRDNHSFRRLTEGNEVKDALEEFDAGYTGGMACAVCCGKHLHDVVQAHGKARREEFIRDLHTWLSLLPNVKSEPRPYMARAVRKHRP